MQARQLDTLSCEVFQQTLVLGIDPIGRISRCKSYDPVLCVFLTFRSQNKADFHSFRDQPQTDPL